MKWSVVEKDGYPIDRRVLTYSEMYRGDDIKSYRILDGQFIKICEDVTHWTYLEPPDEKTSITIYAFMLNPNKWNSKFQTISLHLHKIDADEAMKKEKQYDYEKWCRDEIYSDEDKFPDWILYKVEGMKIT